MRVGRAEGSLRPWGYSVQVAEPSCQHPAGALCDQSASRLLQQLPLEAGRTPPGIATQGLHDVVPGTFRSLDSSSSAPQLGSRVTFSGNPTPIAGPQLPPPASPPRQSGDPFWGGAHTAPVWNWSGLVHGRCLINTEGTGLGSNEIYSIETRRIPSEIREL